MTDLERFIDLYKSFGIELEAVEWMNPHGSYKLPKDTMHYQITLMESWPRGENEKFFGYMGFFSEVIFDADGKFIKQGFWE